MLYTIRYSTFLPIDHKNDIKFFLIDANDNELKEVLKKLDQFLKVSYFQYHEKRYKWQFKIGRHLNNPKLQKEEEEMHNIINKGGKPDYINISSELFKRHLGKFHFYSKFHMREEKYWKEHFWTYHAWTVTIETTNVLSFNDIKFFIESDKF